MSHSRRGKAHYAAVVAAAACVVITTTTQVSASLDVRRDRPAHAVTLSGTYWDVHGDNPHSDETKLYLESGGRHYLLDVPVEPDIASGSQVTVHGEQHGLTISLTSGAAIHLDKAAPKIAKSAIGTKTVLVINVVWPGATLTATKAQEQAFMFGADSRTVASYYRDVSYGQFDLDRHGDAELHDRRPRHVRPLLPVEPG